MGLYEHLPYVNTHELNLAWILDQVKTLTEEWARTRTEFEDLNTEWASYKEYIDNYFANLDVTQEISDKLDQMARDGSLDALILPYFNAYKAEIDTIVAGQNTRMAALSARMDTFSRLPDGSTTGDAELMDIRVGYDGKIWNSAGDAVRGQVSNIHDILDDVVELQEESVQLNFVRKSGYVDTTGTVIPYSNIWGAKISLIPGKTYVLKYRAYYLMCEAVYYDAGGNFISGTASHMSEQIYTEKLVIPANAKTVMIQAYGMEDTIANNYALSIGDTYGLKAQEQIDLSTYILSQIAKEDMVYINLTFTAADGYIDSAGNLNPYSNIWKAQVSVTPGQKLYLDYRSFYAMAEMVFYNSSNIFVSAARNHNDDGFYRDVEILVPQGAAYAIAQEYAASAAIAAERYVLKTGNGDYVVKDLIKDKLHDKTIAYNGDSICESRMTGVSANGGAYPVIISNMTGCLHENRAIGGGILASAVPYGSLPPRCVVSDVQNMTDLADLICFEGGLNDFYRDVPLGDYDDNDYEGALDDTTVCGALESIFRQAINKWVGKPICFVIVHRCYGTKVSNGAGYTFQQMLDKMIGICNKYAIPYYNAYDDSGLNSYNPVQNETFLTAGNTGLPDGIHPNERAYLSYYVPQILTMFRSLIP